MHARVRKTSRAAVLAAALSMPRTAAPDDAAIEKRVEALLGQMTIDEKVGQLHQLSRASDPTGPSTVRDEPNPATQIKDGHLGSMLNVVDAVEAGKLQAFSREARLKVPIILGYDVIHGFRTVFPVPLGEASSWDPALAERSAQAAGREAASVGVHWTFSPMVDVARDPRWGRVVEGAGEDPFLGSAFAAARVRGFRKGGVAACAKHYVGYGGALAGRDYSEVDVSEATLRDVYLPPFKAAVDAGAETFMSAFSSVNGVPASANRHTLTDILRHEWGFKGFVVSDWNSVGELIPHGVAKDKAEATRIALTAGVDMDMEGRCYSSSLAQLVKDGSVPQATLDEAVRRVLRIKVELGLFERGAPDPAAPAKVILSDENKRAARESARDSMVLLKNDGALLPFAAGVKHIALIGPLADAGGEQIGPWSAQGKGEDSVTFLAGLKERAGAGVQVSYVKGCEISGSGTLGFAEAVAAARQADVVVAVLGEAASMSGEAAARTRLDLPGVQQQLLEQLAAAGKPVVLVLLNGRPLALPWAAEHVPAILEAWFPGTMGGPALADLLFGDVSPSGKLPITIPRALGQVPIFYSERPTGRPPTDDHWTSKYIDEKVTPQFAFGHGLSYTTFAYSGLTVTPASTGVQGSVQVAVKVKNTGAREGREVVQLYVRDLVASRSRPLRELKGFEKVKLAAGEEKTVTFTLPISSLGFHDDAGRLLVEPGEFQLWAGGSSTAELSARFEVK